VDDAEPALFDAPAPAGPPADPPAGGRGQTGETYRRTVVADIKVTNVAELRDSALRYFDDSGIGEEMLDDEILGTNHRKEIAAGDAVALSWVIAPTEDLWDLLRAGAVRIIDSDVEIDQSNPDYYRATWEVTIKLRDADRFRAYARTAAGPGSAAAADADRSLAAAWEAAVPPDQPLRRVDGISWTCGSVTVEQVHASPERATGLPG
jgi:hypothetical protein